MDYTGSDHVMANDDRVTFGSALPSHGDGSSSVQLDAQVPRTPAPAPVWTPRGSGAALTTPGKPRQLSEKEWEDLKGLLHMYYIQENKTLGMIRKIVSERHGLVLTQKQLTKRFAKWRFKKNVKQAEIGRFMGRAQSTPGQAEFPVDGVRITAAKRERWQKAARNATPREGLGGSSTSQQLHLGGEDIHQGESIVDVHTPLNDANRASAPSSSTLSPSTINHLPTSDEPCVGLEDDSQQLLADSAEWQSIPTPGDATSWLLHRLFSALSLAPPNDEALFYQSPNAAETRSQTRHAISKEEFMDLTHGGGDIPWHSTQMTIRNPSSRRQAAPPAFRYPGVDAIFSTQEIILASPLDVELYPFPQHNQGRLDPGAMSKYHDILRTEMQECSEKIQKFESVSLGHTEAATVLIDRLAVAYFGLGHYDQAERHFNRILPTLLQRHGANSRYVVSVKRDLAEVILHLGRYEEANQMAQDVHASALSIDVPGGSLVQRSIHVLAQSYGNLRDLNKEEELLRQLVQIRLAASGPRHGDTLAAIRSLCDSLVDAHRYSEGEQLLRVSQELSQSAEVSNRRKCLICRKLATVLYKQGSYHESEAMYRKTVEMSVQLLGDEHPDTLRCRFWLCKVMRAAGRLDDSRKLHLRTVEQQIQTRGELRGSTIESMAALSNLLVQMTKMEEAEAWMKRALRCSQQTGGITSVRATKFWDDLRSLDEGQQQHQRTAELYEEMGCEISTLVGPGSRSIEEMAKWDDRDRR